MPQEDKLTHTHLYQSYLLGLTKNWAYGNTNRTPGHTGEVRAFVKKHVENSKKSTESYLKE